MEGPDLIRRRDFWDLDHLLYMYRSNTDGEENIDFWSSDDLDKIMTASRIEEELSSLPSIKFPTELYQNAKELANAIFPDFRKIFAILTIVNHGHCIEEFVQERITDKQLPLGYRAISGDIICMSLLPYQIPFRAMLAIKCLDGPVMYLVCFNTA